MESFKEFLIIVVIVLLSLGIGYFIGSKEKEICPGCVCSYARLPTDINFLPSLIARYDWVLPWDNSTNFTCLPRALDFKSEAEHLGYNVSIMYGCKTENESCHAWPRIHLDVWGSREDYPKIPPKAWINSWMEGLN